MRVRSHSRDGVVMAYRDLRSAGAVLRRSGLTVGAAVLITSLAAGCSAVKPAGDGSAGAGSNGSADTHSFGTPAVAGEVTQGGKLVIALSAEPDKLDPTLARSLNSRYVFNAMCEKLYDVDAQARIVPQLATALPTVSADGRTVKIPVRDGVKFADGTPSTPRRSSPPSSAT